MTVITENRITTPEMDSCPSWCVIDHTGDHPEDVFHRGSYAAFSVPDGSAMPTLNEKAEIPRLTAHMVTPEFAEEPEAPSMVVVDCGDLWGPYAELDLEQTDEFIRQGKAFLARLEQIREQLATALKEQQS
ncbi:hypothetical protein [Streptomyces sp. NPDC002855]|uniref:DUF6907 domain-containing protein n=1 Tax=Streptomyces sp. NPDC002855 TaxID=3154437 RepID=UPI00332C247C